MSENPNAADGGELPEHDCAPAPPQAEHALLMERCGTWNVQCRYFMNPGEPPMECEATETVEAFGPYLIRSLFRSEMMGQPFEGTCSMGYSPNGGGWQSTWMDWMSPHIFMMTGELDADGKVLEFTCEGPSMMGDGLSKYRTREWAEDDGSRRFEMYVEIPGAGEAKIFEYTYTRAE